MVHNRYESTHQESWKIYQNTWQFSNNPLLRIVRINGVDYSYNSFDNIIKINRILYNNQWEGQCLIIVDNNRSKINTLSSADELAEPAITNYLACLAREEGVEQICFLLAQHAVESCPIPKNLRDIAKLPVDIQKKWLESCLEKLKLLKDKNIYKVVNLSKRQKAIKNY